MTDDGVIISELPVGFTLCDRYRVREKIADGAMASVYLAHDETTATDVALKILDPLRGADPVGRARFEREFEVLSRLHHPSIARCHRLERHGDMDILVLEHVVGETLEARLTRGRLKINEAVQLALKLAEALEVCHGQGILHRDLKPANIILEAERGPVILDFGVAWFSSAANLTRTGAVIGSPHYLAPEAFSSSLVDARADIYALGVILFEMLTGRPIHLAESVVELAVSHLQDEPPSPSSIRPGIPATLDAVVLRAIAPRAEDRFATANELAAALRANSLASGGRLQAKLPCRHCRTPQIIDLSFCPGCGAPVVWTLTQGPYAVQLHEVPHVERCMAWLIKRHPDALAERRTWVTRRLMHTPLPLVVGASSETAEQLAAEAREQGCTPEIVRSRVLVGAKLKASAATPGEMFSACGLHFCTVMVMAILMAVLGMGEMAAMLPGLVAVVGAGVARWYVRRPLLRCRAAARDAHGEPQVAAIRAILSSLKTERARKLAAGAVSRAAPLLVDGIHTAPTSKRHDTVQALLDALHCIAELDAHAAYLMGRSRSRLAAELLEARARAERHDPEGITAVVRLEQERTELTEVALAHDLAARQALQATAAISTALHG